MSAVLEQQAQQHLKGQSKNLSHRAVRTHFHTDIMKDGVYV